MTDIRIQADPRDEHRCTFTVSVPLLPGAARRFGTRAEAAGSPLAEAIFAIDGMDVADVTVSGASVTVTKHDDTPWQQGGGRAVGAAIRGALAAGGPVVAARSSDRASDDSLFDKLTLVFETRINPMVAGHGGRVDLIDVQDGVVLLRLQGGCQGCGMAEVTLRQGIESTLRQVAPEVQGVMDVTDHSSGANPYFAAAKK